MRAYITNESLADAIRQVGMLEYAILQIYDSAIDGFADAILQFGSVPGVCHPPNST